MSLLTLPSTAILLLVETLLLLLALSRVRPLSPRAGLAMAAANALAIGVAVLDWLALTAFLVWIGASFDPEHLTGTVAEDVGRVVVAISFFAPAFAHGLAAAATAYAAADLAKTVQSRGLQDDRDTWAGRS